MTKPFTSALCLPNGPGCYDSRCDRCWEDVEPLTPGVRVEVYCAWAAQGKGRPPLKRWIRGYTLVRVEGDVAIVKHGAGVFAGCEVRHPLSAVRLLNESKGGNV